MANWNDDQAEGERAMRAWEKRRKLDHQLGEVLRASGITADDAIAVQRAFGWSGASGSRIGAAMRAIETWCRKEGE